MKVHDLIACLVMADSSLSEVGILTEDSSILPIDIVALKSNDASIYHVVLTTAEGIYAADYGSVCGTAQRLIDEFTCSYDGVLAYLTETGYSNVEEIKRLIDKLHQALNKGKS